MVMYEGWAESCSHSELGVGQQATAMHCRVTGMGTRVIMAARGEGVEQAGGIVASQGLLLFRGRAVDVRWVDTGCSRRRCRLWLGAYSLLNTLPNLPPQQQSIFLAPHANSSQPIIPWAPSAPQVGLVAGDTLTVGNAGDGAAVLMRGSGSQRLSEEVSMGSAALCYACCLELPRQG